LHGEKVCVPPSAVGLKLKRGPGGTWWGMPGRPDQQRQWEIN
jgi:hypothetical protein